MNKGGHGLGLSICKMIAQKLHGNIEVLSEREEGSTFIFSFTTDIKCKAVRKKSHRKGGKKKKRNNELSVIMESNSLDQESSSQEIGEEPGDSDFELQLENFSA